ncbi:DUF2333 family protein [Thermodesulfobacteriota bacterium]
MDDNTKVKSKKKRLVLAVLIFIAILSFTIIIMVLNSKKPERLIIDKTAIKSKGAVFIKVNEQLIEKLYNNWLPNDHFWPTIFLDNMPNFQIGELEVIRYNIRVLRDNLSRMRTTDKLEPSAEAAFTALSNDPYKWWFPRAESKWKLARKSLGKFHEDLLSGRSHFYPRADNLVELLNQYASLMGGINTRLMNAPRDIKKVLTFDEEKGKKGSDLKMVEVDIPWRKIDDNFYYAQGASFALYESFRAIRVDFIDVLEDKNSVKLVDKILEDLERCYFEPLIVFNGDPDSIFANHSLNLSGMFNDARQKINSLIVALRQG